MTNLLSGMRVLDLTEFLSGPAATLILSDLGAEVLKIEAPNSRAGGERARYTYGGRYSLAGETVLFLGLNRNKKSVVIDLKVEAGREVFYELARKADVVLNNYAYGIPRKLGIDYESVKKVNPEIIYCYLSSFGQSGPYRGRTGYDLNVQAMGGGMSITGEPGRPPVRAGLPVGDLGGGLFSVIGVLSAYARRLQTGKGAMIDVGMLDCQIAMLTHYALYPLVLGEKLGPVGTGSIRGGIIGPNRVEEALFRVYKTKDRYITIALASGGARFWDDFCRAIGHEELKADPRFNSIEKRWENYRELSDILEGVFATRTTSEWLEILLKERLPVAPVNTVDEALSDPHVLSRNMVVTIPLPSGEEVRVVGNPIKVSGLADTDFTPPPKIGQHTEQVMRELLGYSTEKISELRNIKAIG